jgi:hypothetical protein
MRQSSWTWWWLGFLSPSQFDDLAASIEQNINCMTKKGTHLATKVKIICESVLTFIFDGFGRFVQSRGGGEHLSTCYWAKIINLSGNLINLSGYNALCKGVEGDANGKVERNGGWLASKYHVMKCMKAVKTAAQVVAVWVWQATSLPTQAVQTWQGGKERWQRTQQNPGRVLHYLGWCRPVTQYFIRDHQHQNQLPTGHRS